MSTNLIFSIGTILWAGFFLIFSLRLPKSKDILGPGGWPTVILLLMLCLGIALFVRTFKEEKSKKSSEMAEPATQKAEDACEAVYPHRHWLIGGIALLYIIISQYVGMIVATPIFIFVTARILGLSNWIKLVVISLLCTIVILGTFIGAFSLSLPPGIGVFKDFSELFY